MNRRWIIFCFCVGALAALTACEEETPPLNPARAQPAASSTQSAPTAISATAARPIAPTPIANAFVCPRPASVNAKLAAKVNGVGIASDLFDRQVQQAQNAMVQQGLDSKSASGQEALKSLKQQVLDQLINDVVITLEADKRGIKVSDADLNARLAQMIQDAGSPDKLSDYLKTHDLTLADFCNQLRAQILGEAMFNNITSVLPSSAEQVHVRHILVTTPALAQTIRDQLRRGGDFAALAKQYSVDEASKANGGDIGWVPRDVLAPEVDAVIFQLPVSAMSDVITTFYGYEIYQVMEKEKARALPPEIIQNQKQRAFLAWLYAVRETMQIERLAQP
ncbi:MAG: peptidylprolyl isomerase [Chloroflexi bacterium]|nr:peptidylprolyl isomerase [Chloroflexota bacterium]